MVIKSVVNHSKKNVIGKIINIDKKVSGWVIKNKKPALINGPAGKDRRFKNVTSREKISSGICVPMLIRDKVIGTLNLRKLKKGTKFTQTNLEVITIFAQYAAIAVKNAQDYTCLLELGKLKDEFLANVSHELRTPLQSITNACEILEKKYNDERLIQLLKRNSKKMNKLVVELLDITKIEKGEYNISIKPFPVNDILEEVTQDIRLAAKEKEIKIKYKILDEVRDIYADKDMIEKVLLNYLNNAIKYCPEGSKVNIGVSKNKGGIEFSVSDNGPGIPAAEQKHIFSKFYQQKPDLSLTKKHNGIGLGLAIAKSIIERHGGEVNLDSEPGAGSSFKFILPDKKGDK